MKNHYITIAVVTVLTFIVNPVHAEGYAEGHACKSIVLSASGLLSPHACDASLLSALKNSGKYPDVFAAAAPKYIFPDLPTGVPNTSCYTSQGSFAATIDGKPVTVTTLSAWTNDTKPVIFSAYSAEYTDNIGAVITQISVFDTTGKKFYGNIYSRDVVDLSKFSSDSSIEQDTIVGGTKNFAGAKGTFRIESNNIHTYFPTVPIDVLKGTICTDNH